MKNIVRNTIILAIIIITGLLSEFVFGHRPTLIEMILLMGLVRVYIITFAMNNTIEYLKKANDLQYEEYARNVELTDKQIIALKARSLDQIVIMNSVQELLKEICYEKSYQKEECKTGIKIPQPQQPFPPFIDVKSIEQKAAELKLQAGKEENDGKSMGLLKKATREENLAKAIESGIIARLGIAYKVEWDAKSTCLRIYNYQNSGKIAVYYPKGNKLNFKGEWFNNASKALENELHRINTEKC